MGTQATSGADSHPDAHTLGDPDANLDQWNINTDADLGDTHANPHARIASARHGYADAYLDRYPGASDSDQYPGATNRHPGATDPDQHPGAADQHARAGGGKPARVGLPSGCLPLLDCRFATAGALAGTVSGAVLDAMVMVSQRGAWPLLPRFAGAICET